MLLRNTEIPINVQEVKQDQTHLAKTHGAIARVENTAQLWRYHHHPTL